MNQTAADVGNRLVAFLPRMRRFALSLTRSADQADDLVQSAAARVIQAADRFEPGTNFEAWVLRIMRNLWIDRLRANRIVPQTVDIEAGDTIAGEDGVAVTDARLQLSDVGRAILSLPDEHREILILVCVEELSYAEAAEIAGIPVGTVMSRLARARKRLAEVMGINRQGDRSSDEGRGE